MVGIVAAIVVGGAAVAAYFDRTKLKADLTSAVGKAENIETAVKAKIKAAVATVVADAKVDAAKAQADVKAIVAKVEADLKKVF